MLDIWSIIIQIVMFLYGLGIEGAVPSYNDVKIDYPEAVQAFTSSSDFKTDTIILDNALVDVEVLADSGFDAVRDCMPYINPMTDKNGGLCYGIAAFSRHYFTNTVFPTNGISERAKLLKVPILDLREYIPDLRDFDYSLLNSVSSIHTVEAIKNDIANGKAYIDDNHCLEFFYDPDSYAMKVGDIVETRKWSYNGASDELDYLDILFIKTIAPSYDKLIAYINSEEFTNATLLEKQTTALLYYIMTYQTSQYIDVPNSLLNIEDEADSITANMGNSIYLPTNINDIAAGGMDKLRGRAPLCRKCTGLYKLYDKLSKCEPVILGLTERFRGCHAILAGRLLRDATDKNKLYIECSDSNYPYKYTYITLTYDNLYESAKSLTIPYPNNITNTNDYRIDALYTETNNLFYNYIKGGF